MKRNLNDIIVDNGSIIDKDTGEILGVISPKFLKWDYAMYAEEFNNTKELRFLEPMTAQELDEDKLQKHIAGNRVVGEQKFDGHRGLVFITSKGNRIFSRRVSKQTGWYAENTDCMPHIRDIVVPEDLYGTVIDGEILLPVENCTCRQVQSVTGALPETAIKYQLENGFAYLSAFDILYYKGINIQRMPLWKRKLYLWEVLLGIKSDFIHMCTLYCNQDTMDYLKFKWEEYGADQELIDSLVLVHDFEQQFRQFLKEGKEGLIIKDIEGIYEQKRSKAFVKMKAHKTYDVVIMGYDEPTREYTGKELKTWMYWEVPYTSTPVEGMYYEDSLKNDEYIPVTKYWAKEWIGAVIFGVWKDGKLIEVGRTSGMDEETRQLLSENREEYLGQVIEVEAQGIINKETGSLQHPRFIQFRPDKSSEMCTFQAHIREEDK